MRRSGDHAAPLVLRARGPLGYSIDTLLAPTLQHGRWARLADGTDEVHQMRIAQRAIAAFSLSLRP